MADTPISPDQAEQEEFEFRARAEEEARRAEEANNPKFEEPSMLDKAAAAGLTATQFAEEHPIAATAIGTGAATAASKIPVIGPAATNLAGRAVGAVVPKPIVAAYNVAKDIGGSAVEAAHNYNTNSMTTNLARLQQQIRLGEAAGHDVSGLKQAANQIVDKLSAAMPKTPAAPPTPPVGGPAAAQGETFLSRMAQQFGGIAQKVSPILNNPVTRAVGTGLNNATPAMTFAVPYQMAAHEMEKIRANPHAPEYANNPYAMQIRGEAPTMGAAGAMNRRRALQQMPSLQQGNE